MEWHENPVELKKVRKYLGISQKALSQLSGVTSSWLAAVETGRFPLTGPKAQAAWTALAEISPDCWMLQNHPILTVPVRAARLSDLLCAPERELPNGQNSRKSQPRYA